MSETIHLECLPGAVQRSIDTLAALEQARNLIARPDGWTQGANARDADGEPVYTTSPLASCWCMGGAVIAAFGGDDDYREALRALGAAASGNDSGDPWDTGGTIALWNDRPGRTHGEVVALFDRVIATVREQIGGDA